MKRRFNWTGRKQIPLDCIAMQLVDTPAPLPKSFSAELSRLADLGLSPDARVYVEPYVKSSSMRFDFGTVGAIRAPNDLFLTDLDVGGSILFRIKVVDESGNIGRILASANEVRPKNEGEDENDLKAILPLRLRDLGEMVWIVDLGGAARPELVINNRIPALADRIGVDPLIQGLIIPEAIRQILKAVLIGDEVDDEIEWVQDWRKFSESVLGEGIQYDADEDELAEKIDLIVDKYCSQMKFTTRVAASLAEVGGGAIDY